MLGVLCTIFAVLIVRAIAALPVGMPMLRDRLARYAPVLGIVNVGGPLLLPPIATRSACCVFSYHFFFSHFASFAYGWSQPL